MLRPGWRLRRILLLAANDGGYFPPEWGWSGVALAWVAAVALVIGRNVRARLRRACVSRHHAAIAVWTAVSALWADAAQAPVLEVERTLVYVALVATLLVTGRRGGAGVMLAGAGLAGIADLGVCAGHAPAARLFGLYDDPVAHGRLYQPLGYWNALGIFAAMTVVLCLGAAMRGRTQWVRVAAAAALPPVSATLFFTFSRGSMIAVAIGVGVGLALDRDRLARSPSRSR